MTNNSILATRASEILTRNGVKSVEITALKEREEYPNVFLTPEGVQINYQNTQTIGRTLQHLVLFDEKGEQRLGIAMSGDKKPFTKVSKPEKSVTAKSVEQAFAKDQNPIR